jgi:hypothetical protein
MTSAVKDAGAAQSAAAAQRAAGLVKANRRRREEGALKAEVRSGRLDFTRMVNDRRARKVKVLTLLRTMPRCTLHVALEALLVSRINGARCCGDLTTQEQSALADALAQVGHAVGGAGRPPLGDGAPRRDKALDEAIGETRRDAPLVELAPSEFAAARTGLEADPLLLRMVDRLIDAVRLYAQRDDGGLRARVVAEQWVRYRNYVGKVARGECPPPAHRSPARLE